MRKIAFVVCVAAVAASAPAMAETYYSAKANNGGETSLASPGVAGAWTNATGVSRNYIDDSTGGDVFASLCGVG